MYTSKRLLLWGTLLIAIGGLVLWWTQTPLQDTHVPINIGYRAHDLYSPLFVGIEQKIFERAGITINPIKFESTNQLTDAFLANTIDAALGGVNIPLLLTLEEKSAGTFKMFSVVHETDTVPTSFLLIRKDSPITRIQELRGKKIGANPGSTMQFIYRRVVTSSFNPKEATLIQMKPELELPALESGQIDAAIVLEPYATIAVEKGIARVLAAPLFNTYVMPDMPLAASIVSTKFFNKHPEDTRQLITATDEAIQFINTNPRETKTALAHYLPIDATVIETLHIPKFTASRAIDWNKIQELSDILTSAGELKSAIDIQSLTIH